MQWSAVCHVQDLWHPWCTSIDTGLGNSKTAHQFVISAESGAGQWTKAFMLFQRCGEREIGEKFFYAALLPGKTSQDLKETEIQAVGRLVLVLLQLG